MRIENAISNTIKRYSKNHTDLETAIFAAGLGLEVRVTDLEEEELEISSGRSRE